MFFLKLSEKIVISSSKRAIYYTLKLLKAIFLLSPFIRFILQLRVKYNAISLSLKILGSIALKHYTLVLRCYKVLMPLP